MRHAVLPAQEKAAQRLYRLPTEAQWEYACRAGTATRFSFGDEETDLGDYGWCKFGSNRVPVPSGEAQRKTMILVRKLYQEEIQSAKTTEQKEKLAQQILHKARAMTEDPDGRFGSLSLAREIASRAGAGDAAFEVAEEMAKLYVVDIGKLKVETVHRLFLAAQSAAERKAVIDQARRLLEDSVAKDRFDLAQQVCAQALNEAKKTTDNDLIESLVNLSKSIRRKVTARAAYENGQRALEEKPDDGEANLAVGRYRCLVSHDWKGGLPYLAKGRDKKLQALARQELTDPPAKPEDQVSLADAWWDLAHAKEGDEKKNLQLHAVGWYRKAQGKLPNGLVTTKLEKRMAEVDSPTETEHGRTSGRKNIRPIKSDMALARGIKLNDAVKLEVVPIPAGFFLMGDDANGPVHKVMITKPFWMGKYEVSQEQWQAVMGNNPSHFKFPKNPVENVSWEDVKIFLGKLNGKFDRSGLKFSLPTEAQWEYACRAGNQTHLSFGDAASELGDYAWLKSNSENRTHPVGQKKPNAWGLYDMYGNVVELCADWLGGYNASPQFDPTGPRTGNCPIVRGECFKAKEDKHLTACRFGAPGIATRVDFMGFRIVVVRER